ncbi:hypothetical protein FRB96_000285 [Tulasnella sp. 330]|nr:hypothetical protein FRB96_000285 [Tulasnella sp. 330]KAG8886875.1 hypothetical protein FRB98_000901 [Tulasnella sp. 332]
MGQPPVLTRHQFASAAKELVRDQEDKRLKADDPISILYQGWVWQEHSTYSHLGYLERSVTVYDGLPVDIEDPATDDAVLETLDASEAPSCQSLPRFMMQQYVAWSVTYEVPVFYFTLHDSGGAPIPLDRMYNTSIFRKSRQLAKTPKDLTSALFPASSQSDVHEEESVPFPLLSQGDHPVLGTGHLARKLLETLRANQPSLGITARDLQCVTIAGLCHDLGHGPFSHVFDGHFVPAVKGPRPDGSYWCHEEASEMMLDALVKENDIPLSQDRVNFIKDLISGTPRLSLKNNPPEKRFLFEIVSNKRNGIDVDKWDYIARDTKAVGETCTLVASRLIEAARVIGDQIAYNWKDAQSVYELFYSRYSLHKRIYSHKTAKAVEHMIVTALIAAEPVLHLAEAIDDPKKYLYVTDSVVEDIERSNDPRLATSQAIIRKLRRREIPKRVEEKCLPSEFEARWKKLITPQTVADMSRKLLEQRKRDAAIARHDDELNQPMKEVVKEYLQDTSMAENTAMDDREDDVAAPLMPAVELEQDTRRTESMDLDEEALTADDVIIDFSTLHFGMKDSDPLEHVSFYGKGNMNVCLPVRPDESGYMRPERFQEVILRCYATDAGKRSQVQDAFRAVLQSLPHDVQKEQAEESATIPKHEVPVEDSTPTEAPSTPTAGHSRTGSGSFFSATGSPDTSPRGRRRGPSMTPNQPNSFTTIQRTPNTLGNPKGEKTGRKRRSLGGDGGSPEKKKKLAG